MSTRARATVRGPKRRLPVGGEVQPGGGTHFRVWAPRCSEIEIVLEEDGVDHPLAAQPGGYFAGLVRPAADGSLYRLRLDGAAELVADPVSRFQPNGPHGPSRVVDPGRFTWSDRSWAGIERRRQVIYELHVGTFTKAGTWEAAAEELEELAELGITVVEMMPVADFPGRFGWGYDGVNLFAPTRLYGEPDDLRRFVDRAHAIGIGVILDVVYNHFGPDGNFLPRFSDTYLSRHHATDWGDALNFDDDGSGPVRELFVANAGYWIEEFHFDGLRLDATQDIRDDSPEHVITALARRVREAGKGRSTYLVAENEPQDTRMVRATEAGGHGLDAMWNDDFHHAAMVAMTGRSEAYYTDYRGAPQEFISVAKHGFLYQGQWYGWQGKRRGTPTVGIGREQLVNFIQNHDQVANSGHGLRAHLLTGPGQYKAMTALLLLLPGTPMLFQGQEFAASSPFFYFANQKDEIAVKVAAGRAEFLAQFRSLALPEMQRRLPDPGDPETFVRSKLDLTERVDHREIYAMHRDLLRLRREDPVLSAPEWVDGAVISGGAFILRYGAASEDRLLVVNLGRDLHLDPAPEPLLAPPRGEEWRILWSTEDTSYGGVGTAPLDTEKSWEIPGHAAVVLAPARDEGDDDG